jgi:PAS domain S-box-containing protein
VAGIVSLISRRFQSALVAAESTGAFFISSQEVTKEEFDVFASVLTKNIVSGSIAMPITVEWVDAKNNIRYIYPMNEDNAKIVGLDLNQYPNRLLPITKAKATRSAVVTEPIMLGQGYPGMLLYSPIFRGGNYFGQAVVVMRLSNFLAPIPGENSIYNKNIYIQTGNFIIPFEKDIILNNNGEQVINPQGDLAKDAMSQKYSNFKKGVISKEIVFADKIWQLKFSPVYIQAVNQRVGIYVGFFMLFVSVSVSFLWILQNRQKRLSEEKAKTEALFFSIGDALVACDKNEIITFGNKKAEELSGYDKKEMIGKLYYNAWHLYDSKGNAVPAEKRILRQAMMNKKIVTISLGAHYSILKKDGTYLPIASTIAPIIINEKVEGAIVVFRDIIKETEVDRMKTEFLSLASHQLLTPSSAVKWGAETLLKKNLGKLNKKQTEYLQNIYNSNESMIGLINSLLNISRIESGRIIVVPSPTNLQKLVKDVVKELENKIQEKNQIFNFTSEKGLPEMNVDPRLIKEVYKNLLTNAIKYTPKGGNISLAISMDKKNIISKISDNGYGIPAKDKNRIFEKFYRGENIIAKEKDGNGLGLYLIKQIVEVSGGKIWFESEINKGEVTIS